MLLFPTTSLKKMGTSVDESQFECWKKKEKGEERKGKKEGGKEKHTVLFDIFFCVCDSPQKFPKKERDEGKKKK